jgi:ABC-type phosphate transport system substrate-binding protein
MNNMNLIKSTTLLLTVLLSTVALADSTVIVNTGNTNAIADNDIARIFLGKMKKYANGDSVAPVNSKFGNTVRTEFEKKALKKSSSQVKAYWSKRVFSGKGKPPKEVVSDAEVIAFVAATPGAIGYVDAASVNDTVKSVKTF